MRHTFVVAAGILAVCVGVVLFTHYDKAGMDRISEDSGMYSYTCSNGAELSMTPSEGMSSVHVVPGAGASFPETSLAQKDVQTYGTGDMTLVGSGEHIRVISAGTTYECDPVPSQTDAPFNWGDPSEGAAVSHESAETVRANIVGTWRSVEDPLSVREFLSSGSVIDTYDDGEPYRQGWSVFTKDDAPAAVLGFTPEAGRVYISMREGGDAVPGMFFSVDNLTADTLEMTYMDRGSALTYKRVQ